MIDFTYTGAYPIVAYDCPMGSFARDEQVTGFTVGAGVTTIRRFAFCDCPNLTSLGVMREGVTAIDWRAFAFCPLLTSLQGLPESLTTIGSYAFANAGLTSLDGLPSTVTTIGSCAFRNCYSLTSIGPGFSPDCSVHPRAFDDCSALLAAAKAKGFPNVTAWGKHRWLAVHRSAALAAVRRSRPLLPAVLVRKILEDFAGVW